MNKKINILSFAICCLPFLSFSQSGTWNTLLQQLSQPKSTTQASPKEPSQTAQDTTKPKPTGSQSSLAVSDEGTPSNTKNDSPQSNGSNGKSGQDKKPSGNPIENIKSKLTKAATQNNNNSGTTSNLAVSDEGTPSDSKGGKGKTNRATDTNSNSPNPNQGNTTTVANPK